MPLKALSRPPPHWLSTFITASAANTRPGWAVVDFTGLRDGKLPAGLIQVSVPPRYWYPMIHWSKSASKVGNHGRVGQDQIVEAWELVWMANPTVAAANRSGGFSAICTAPPRACNRVPLWSSA